MTGLTGAGDLELFSHRFGAIARAKLVLTDELIAEMLRQKKATEAVDETAFDDIEEDTSEEE